MKWYPASTTASWDLPFGIWVAGVVYFGTRTTYPCRKCPRLSGSTDVLPFGQRRVHALQLQVPLHFTRGLAKPANGTPIRKTPRNGPLAPSVGYLLAMCGRRKRCQCAFSVVAPGSSAVSRPCWRLMGHQLGRSGIDEGKSRRSPKTEWI